MATGDTWTCTASALHIRSGPSTSYSSKGFLYTGDTIVEVSQQTASNGGIWIEHSGGWSCAVTSGGSSYLYISQKATTVSTTTENSAEPGYDEEVDGYGYQPDTGDILSYTNDNVMDSEFAQIKHIAGVLGLPYQFLPTADPRLAESTSVGNIGYEYGDKIVSRMPLLFLAPGKASFMTKYSKKNKESILEKILTLGVNTNSTSIDDLLNKDGRYYTFEYDSVRYYKFVNPMCRIAARYLNIHNVKINGTNLDNMNWEEYTRSGIKSIGDFGTYTSVPFYIDTETQISEAWSNSVTQSMLASSVNSVSDMGRELNFLLGYTQAGTGVEAINNDAEVAANIENINDAIKGLLGSGSFLSNLSTHIATVASGGKLVFPEIWADSVFSRSYSVNIKLVSPDPSKLSIFLNILVPLFHLLSLVAPQSIESNPNGYTNPFLVRAIYKGHFNIDMGIITDMSVTKGAECQWTPDGLPTSIEVSLSIKDLYNALTITETKNTSWKYDTLNNTALMDYIANLCGINIYKPEISRIIEMWWVNNFENRIDDFFKLDIWGGIQEKVQNGIMNIFR